MKHKFTKLLAAALATVMILATFVAIIPVSATTATAPTLVVENGIAALNWNYGYVGSDLNKYNYVNKVKVNTANTSTYRYTDVFTVPKAGTTLTWCDPAGASVANTAYLVSSWKYENGEWVIDLDAANIRGDGANTRGITLYYATDKVATYTYTTKTDNEQLRLCTYGTTGSDVMPEVRVGTSNTTTEGVLNELIWFPGYTGSATHATVAFRNAIAHCEGAYTYSAPILIPKAGTTISFTDSASYFASAAANVFTIWEPVKDGNFAARFGYAGDCTAIYTDSGSARTYYYTTSYDNEYVSVCYRSDASKGTLPASFPTVTLTENSDKDRLLSMSYYDAAYYELIRDVKWNKGYIGSDTNSASRNTIKKDAPGYHYSDVFTVYGKGSLVMFTDIKGTYASGSAYAIASFASNDNTATTVDTTAANVRGDDATHYFTNPDGSRTYYYYTTKDIEYLRVSLRSDGTNRGALNPSSDSAFVPPCVYAITSATLDTTVTGSSEVYTLPRLNPTIGKYTDLFAGKEMVIIGDSYFAGNGINRNLVWPQRFADLYGMNFTNYGVNGSTISSYVTTNNPMVDRYQSMTGGITTDLVLFEGGRNDYNQKAPIGSPTDTTPNTFYGALHVMINGLLEKYPNALIVCLNPWELTGVSGNNANSAGHTSNDYAAAFCNYVNQFGNPRVQMLNTNDPTLIPVYIREQAFRDAYAQTTTDISHMNAFGMAHILPYFEAKLAELMGNFRSTFSITATGAGKNTLNSIVDSKMTLPMPENTDGFIGWSGEVNGATVLYPANTEISIPQGTTATFTPMYLSINGGSQTMRLTPGSTGIRFLTEYDLAQYNAITAIPGVTIKHGTLIVPEFYMEALGGKLTFDSLQETGKLHLDVPSAGWYQTTATTGLIAGSIANIYANHYTLPYVAQGYATVTFSNGTSATFYAKNASATATTVYGLATDASNDRSPTQSDVYCYEMPDGSFSPYTTAQHEILNSFNACVLEIVEGNGVLGLEILQKGSITYVMTYDEENEELVITTSNGTPITGGTITSVTIAGYARTFRIEDGKLLVAFSNYTNLY